MGCIRYLEQVDLPDAPVGLAVVLELVLLVEVGHARHARLQARAWLVREHAYMYMCMYVSFLIASSLGFLLWSYYSSLQKLDFLLRIIMTSFSRKVMFCRI